MGALKRKATPIAWTCSSNKRLRHETAAPSVPAPLPGAQQGPMAEFFQHYGADEACCMCLMAAVLHANGSLHAERPTVESAVFLL